MTKEIKVGDKVRVTGNKYPNACPRGSICTVARILGGGCIRATLDGGDGYEWYPRPNHIPPGSAAPRYVSRPKLPLVPLALIAAFLGLAGAMVYKTSAALVAAQVMEMDNVSRD